MGHTLISPPSQRKKIKCSYSNYRENMRKSFVRFRRWSHCHLAALSLDLVVLVTYVCLIKPATFQTARFLIFLVVCRDFMDYAKSCRSPSLHGLSLVGLSAKCHTHLRCYQAFWAFQSIFCAWRMQNVNRHSGKNENRMLTLYLVLTAQVERIRGQLDAVTDARSLQQLMRHLPLILLAWWRGVGLKGWGEVTHVH